MKHSIFLICSLLVFAALAASADGHSEFKKALQKKHEFKSVSCYTCHSREAEVPKDKLEAFKENKKAFRNAFGELFAKELKDKDITKRLAAVKDLDADDEKRIKVSDEATKEFLESLKAIEKMKSPEGPTYGELLKKGTLNGVKRE